MPGHRVDLGLYCDHNAAAPLLPEVRAAVMEAEDELWGNESSPHDAGAAARARLETCRRTVGQLLDVDPRRVVFTSGATEANAIALQPGVPVYAAAVEHPSALAWATHRIAVDSGGVVDLNAVDAAAASAPPRARFAVQAANNETGVIQPIAEVAALLSARGLALHIDATQLPGRVSVRAVATAASTLALSTHKAGGPKGVGILVVDPDVQPLLRGGPQERGLRPGTVPVPLVVGLTVALQLAESAVAAGAPSQLSAARDVLEGALVARGGQVMGAGRPRLPNTTAVVFSVDTELLVMALALAGVCASTGAACSSGASAPSHVLAAMGVVGRPLRLSIGHGLDLDRALVALGALDAVLAAEGAALDAPGLRR